MEHMEIATNSETHDDHIEVLVLGTKIGEASGWDQIDDDCMFFYDFTPNYAGMKLGILSGHDVQLNLVSGVLEVVAKDRVELLMELQLQLKV